jgi:hypothetical protein
MLGILDPPIFDIVFSLIHKFLETALPVTARTQPAVQFTSPTVTVGRSNNTAHVKKQATFVAHGIGQRYSPGVVADIPHMVHLLSGTKIEQFNVMFRTMI